MQEIKLCRLEKWIEASGDEAQVIVGPPCEALLRLQGSGHCVLAELSHLQGLDEEKVAEALGKEEAIMQFENVCICAEELPQAYLRRIWCNAQGIPVQIAETERLIIRESVVEDAEAFWKLYRDSECRKYLQPPPVNMEYGLSKEARERGVAAYRRYIEEYRKGQYAFFEYGMWTVVEKKNGAVVGRAGLEQQAGGVSQEQQKGQVDQEQQKMQVSLGYAILPEYRGRGYAVEACGAILDYCKECGYEDQVAVTIDDGNAASKGVYQKLIRDGSVLLE